VGKNVLNQKSELQKAMDKHRDQAARKEAEKEKLNNKTAFEKVIEERARRLESVSATVGLMLFLSVTSPLVCDTFRCRLFYFILGDCKAGRPVLARRALALIAA
jgi:Protein of unknown function (DUF1151)